MAIAETAAPGNPLLRLERLRNLAYAVVAATTAFAPYEKTPDSIGAQRLLGKTPGIGPSTGQAP
jgi:hypothetical protein